MLYVKYLKQKKKETEKTYKDYNNLFNKLIKKAKSNFYTKSYQNFMEIPRDHSR